jgi:hypothetical protein
LVCMTTMMGELIDWAVLEDEILDDASCYDCSEKAVWTQTFACCGLTVPKCDMHKKMQEVFLRRVEKCTKVTWNCLDCGAKGVYEPGIKVWDHVTWEPL